METDHSFELTKDYAYRLGYSIGGLEITRRRLERIIEKPMPPVELRVELEAIIEGIDSCLKTANPQSQ